MIDITVNILNTKGQTISQQWEDLPIETHSVLANFIEQFSISVPLHIIYNPTFNIFSGRCTYLTAVNYIRVELYKNSFYNCLGAILGHELGHAYYFAKDDDRRNTEINADLFAVKLGCTPSISHTDVIFGNESEVEYERKFNIALEGYYAKNNREIY